MFDGSESSARVPFTHSASNPMINSGPVGSVALHRRVSIARANRASRHSPRFVDFVAVKKCCRNDFGVRRINMRRLHRIFKHLLLIHQNKNPLVMNADSVIRVFQRVDVSPMPRSARVVISDSRQQVVFGPSLIPLGYLPALTPFHHEADEIGSSVRTSLRRTSLSALSISVKGLLCNLKSFYLVKLSNIIYLYKSLFQYITFLRRRRLSVGHLHGVKPGARGAVWRHHAPVLVELPH